MATTARTLITNALRDLAAIGARQPVSADDLEFGLTTLNEWVGSLRTQRTATFMVSRHVLPLTAGVGSYTIGPGGAFNLDRPNRIEGVGLVFDRTAATVTEVSLGRPLNLSEYQHVVAKAQTSTHPYGVYYDWGMAAGLGTIRVIPTPSGAVSDLVLYLPSPVQRFTDLSTTYHFPDGYERAIRANLAIELAPAWEREPSGALVARASEAMADVRRANHRPRILSVDATLLGIAGGYNVWTDR